MDLVYPKTHRRGRTEVILEVLEAVNKIHSPTKLMYHVNASWHNLSECLELLVGGGFVSRTNIKKKRGVRNKFIYHLTDKGVKFLYDFKEFRKQLGELQVVN